MGANHRFPFALVALLGTVVTGMAYTAGAADQTASAPPAAHSFSFGIVPQRTATQLAESWTPLLNHLGARTGYRLDFKTARDICTFTQRVAAGAYDLAYISPYHYVVSQKQQGYRVFAKEKDRELTGIIVVRADSPYRSLRDLQGKALSFPASAFAANLVPRVQLKRERIQFNSTFVASHDSVYLGVAQGLFVGGGGIRHTFTSLSPEIRGQLRVLWTSEGYTPHAIAAHPRVPRDVVKRVAAALIALHQDLTTLKLLQSLRFNGFVAATDAEYNAVRKLEPQLRGLVGND